MKKSHGFHLTELLSVVAIIGILTAFSVPIYSQYLVQARRLQAANTLTRLALAMEKFHIEHNTYENATLAALNFPESIAKNNYRLLIQTASNNDYTLLAEPLGKQARNDKHCAGLLLSTNEKRGVTGNGKVDECW